MQTHEPKFAVVFAALPEGGPPEWVPEAGLLLGLGPSVSLAKAANLSGRPLQYKIRLPEGWRVEEVARSGTEPRFRIEPAEARPDGSRPQAVISVQEWQTSGGAPTPRRVLVAEMANRARGQAMGRLTLEKAEQGRIGGEEWARVRFRATSPGAAQTGSVVTRGVLYAGVDAAGRRTVVVTLTDTEPHAPEPLGLLESMAHTLRLAP